ncbi:UNVERIFIED_CONTAM: putative ribonuclease H protein [Sesamum radiatum]|uniref:Ribonuclease H protein n=1 Tax=Sesamum radiatum TaxID=300843 RepID=A0AAW2J0U5_SESRA
MQVSDFRPIACCNVLYKALTKILLRRLQTVLHLLIDYSQKAFIPGRAIADNVMLAQELLAGYNQNKLPPRCTIKIDIHKADDSVNWDFILESLRIFNFSISFIGWMEQCITTASFSISLNGSIHGFFQGARGIRQGDPMSPYLFVIVMEVWHVLLKFRVQNSALFQYHWKCRELEILNLCFADNVLIFCSGTIESVSVIRDVLSEFAAMSGLQVNPNKSQVILSKSVSHRQPRIELMGFQEGILPIKYLGVPLVASRLSIADCQPLLHKIDCRLAGWEQHNLSLAGRTQLIRLVLSSLHTYWASVFILPKSVINAIEQRMRTFLWKGSSGRGYAKVSWVQVCRPKEEGGLGIRRVLYLNRALMLKHVWRLLQEDTSSIWVAWVMRYRLQHQTLWTYRSTTSSWCWTKLVKLSSSIRPGLEYRVGDGQKFKLWTDIWHPHGPLLHSFPRGSVITELPVDALLSSVIQHNGWNWPSATDFHLQEIIAGLPLIFPNQPDSILWKSNGGKFSTGAVLSLLQPPSSPVQWHRLLGGRFKIPRHDFILWLAILERLSTMDRPWVLQHDLGCVLCAGQHNETHSHIFFACSFSARCVTILKRKVRFLWLGLGWQRDINWACKRWRGKHLLNSASRALLAALTYNIWMERNWRKFVATAASAEFVARKSLDDVRLRILGDTISPSLQRVALYRTWKIS